MATGKETVIKFDVDPKRRLSTNPDSIEELKVTEEKNQIHNSNHAEKNYGATSEASQPSTITQSQAERTITVPAELDAKGKSAFASNFVRTAKYSACNFIPKFLVIQFKMFANIYFGIQSVLVCIPQISPYYWYSQAAPFIFILFVGAVQEGYEDLGRHADDNKANGKKATVLKEGIWDDQVAWKDIIVGDIIEISNNEQVPADAVILATEETKDTPTDKAGSCFVDTKALDGETNKKEYVSFQETCHLRTEKVLNEVKLTIETEAPNSKLYALTGKMTIQGKDPLKLGKEHVLLREMTVSGTNKVWAVVIYTGVDTKIQKNNETSAENKVSAIMVTLNSYIRYIFAIQVVICLICAIFAGAWFAKYGTDSWYLALSDEYSSSFSTNWFGTNNAGLVGIMSAFTFFILLGNMLPISLYVTINSFIKFFSGYFIDWDQRMHYAALDQNAKCRNSTIIEETGQIQFVLSDKTGTLTQNKMQFLKCVIAGTSYGAGVTEVQMAQALLDGTQEELLRDSVSDDDRRASVESFGQDEAFIFYDQAINGKAWCNTEDGREVEGVRDYLRALALCHTVQPRVNEKDPTKVDYSAESPDDGALVMAAANLGFKLKVRARLEHGIQELHLEEPESDDVSYRLLDTMGFTPDRKRMDVIVQFPEDIQNNQVTVICKGADNFVRDACFTQDEIDTAKHHDTAELVTEHAEQGLRTLFVAQGKTSFKNFEKWQKEYNAIKGRDDMDPLAKIDAMDVCEKKLERGVYNDEGLKLLGSTALEDALQESVGETLRKLREGGIKTWVLTGDKVGTAIEIGTACELLTDFMNKTIIVEKLPADEETGEPERTITADEILEQVENGLSKGCPNDVSSRKKLKAAAEADFGSWDTDGSGEVDLKEFLAAGYTEAEFNEMDLDNNGILDLNEIIASKTQPALVIEGGALSVLGIGAKEDEVHGLALATKTLEKAKSSKPVDNAQIAQAQSAFDLAKDQTFKMKAQQVQLIKAASKCQAVLCCRATPQQKGDITRLVKEHLGKITLGVGDGANDVDMIKAAHVGVGIQGVEGSQAVNSADFALSQFKHLQNILFVHGRWSYRRIARAVVYFFYKNMIPTLTILFYIMVTGFSGSGMYNDMVISGYNLLFTSLPVIVFALMEQDMVAEQSLKLTNVYTLGQNSELLNPKVFGLWIGESVWASLICFTFVWYSLNTPCEEGKPRAQGQISIMMFTCVLLVVTARLAIDTSYWTWVHAVVYIGSILLWFFFIMVECSVPAGVVTDGTMYWDFWNLADDVEFYLIIPLVVITSCLPSYLYRSYNRNYNPPECGKKYFPLMQGPNVVEQAQTDHLRESQRILKDAKANRKLMKLEKRRSTLAGSEGELAGSPKSPAATKKTKKAPKSPRRSSPKSQVRTNSKQDLPNLESKVSELRQMTSQKNSKKNISEMTMMM